MDIVELMKLLVYLTLLPKTIFLNFRSISPQKIQANARTIFNYI